MIEVVRSVPPEKVVKWLEDKIKPALTPDVSNYAKGRLRDLIGWDWEYCLVTYSGERDEGISISPHRDASYADYEAWGWHLSGTAEFQYWEGRHAFGYAPNSQEFDPKVDPPTHTLSLKPGDVLRFNCKNLHPGGGV